MNRQPNTIYEDTSTCLTCWSGEKEQPSKNDQIRTTTTNKDKKISLKKQAGSYKRIDYDLPICQTSLNANDPKTTRGFSNPQNDWNQNMATEIRLLVPISERNTYKTHNVHTLNNQQDFKSPEWKVNYCNGIMLTQTTKLQRSNPMSKEELFKTRKNVPSSRKASTSLLHGRESVCSFTENYDLAERIQESQILLDYFNPSEARLNEIKALYKMRQSRKSSINLLE